MVLYGLRDAERWPAPACYRDSLHLKRFKNVMYPSENPLTQSPKRPTLSYPVTHTNSWSLYIPVCVPGNTENLNHVATWCGGLEKPVSITRIKWSFNRQYLCQGSDCARPVPNRSWMSFARALTRDTRTWSPGP